MAKFYGVIGFSVSTETTPGVWDEVITEKNYYAEVLANNRKLQPGESVNDNLNIGNRISLIADPYASLNFFSMRYVIWMGTKWKITSIDVQSPRLILTLGGVYNGH